MKTLALVLGILASFAVLGCGGGDKKPAEKPATKTEAPVEKKEEAKPVAKVKPTPKSPLYKYALHVDDEKKVPPMTDEIIAEFEKHAKPIKIAAKDDKKGQTFFAIFLPIPFYCHGFASCLCITGVTSTSTFSPSRDTVNLIESPSAVF